jgi:hypothetical protein
MTQTIIRDAPTCRERSNILAKDGDQLRALGSQWYAVSYFYAAYHAVRAALMEDSVFGELDRLKTHGKNWIPDDRWNSHHQARRGNGSAQAPGVSDMVSVLYPSVAVDYAQLHSASIAVRYGLGLSGYDADGLAMAFTTIADAARAGKLAAA